MALDVSTPTSYSTKPSRRTSLELLARQMREDRMVLKTGREEMVKATRLMAGPHWSERSADSDQPFNVLEMFVRAMVQNLCAKNPRFLLTVWDVQKEPLVTALQEWGNTQSERQRFDLVFQRIVVNGLFWYGVAKVGITMPAEGALKAFRPRPGEPYIASVDPDDHCYDTRAKQHEEVGYEANRMTLPWEYVKESKIYNRAARDRLTPNYYNRYNQEGDEKIGFLHRGDYGYDGGVEEMVDVWEVYYPRRRMIQTLVADATGMVPTGEKSCLLREAEWIGPDEGPFHWLAYGVVPGNIRPHAPVMHLVDLHKWINEMARKLWGQTRRQKNLTLALDPDDAEAVNQAADGVSVYVKKTENMQPASYNGPDPRLFQMLDYAINKFDQFAGNLSTMLGLRSLAGTAKQEEIINSNASQSLASLQEVTTTHMSRACKAWMWYEYHSPHQHTSTTVRAPFGLREYDQRVQTFPNLPRYRNNPVTADMTRSVPWEQLGIRIDPYSVQFSTPAQKAGQLKDIMTGVILPALGLFQEQGKVPDLNFFLERVSRYMDNPDIARLMNVTEPPSITQARQQGGAAGDGAGMPAQTTRNYVRRSESSGQGNSGLGSSDAVSNMLSAGKESA